MDKKKTYSVPHINIVNMSTSDNIAQFVVTSKSIGEDAGEAKRSNFSGEDWEDDFETGTNGKSSGNSLWED